MLVIGIDPGLATTGIGLIECDSARRCKALDWLVISTKAGIDTPQRLMEIAHDLAQFIADTKPEIAVIEKIFFATNKKTAIDVSQARGVILLTAQKAGLRILEPTPLQLKTTIAGDGKADKRQMQDMVQRTLKLAELPQPDDAADALALALYGAYNGHLLDLK